MPSFYSKAPPNQLPPTPPYYCDYSATILPDVRQLPAPHPLKSFTQQNSYDYGRLEALEAMSQYQRYKPLSGLPISLSEEKHRHGLSDHASSNLGSSSACNTAANAPLLPPMRISDHTFNDLQQNLSSKHVATLTKPSEEKVVGGVAACLDYKMEDMIDFVAMTAHGMYEIYGSKLCLADIDISRSVVNSKTPLPPGIHKFVSQMLSSTRLPSSTILLGLHYLATRMTLLSIEQQFQYGNGSVHRMLTTALLLGSKFLDDNTFQNRSWSEVSGIPVEELNQMEANWLTAVQWNMHIDCGDSKGFLLWYQQWQRYQANKANNNEPVVQSLRQTHRDHRTSQAQQSSHQSLSPTSREASSFVERYQNNGLKDSAQWSISRCDILPPPRSQIHYSPPSAPETGPNTPEWHNQQNAFRFASANSQAHPASKVHVSSQIGSSNGPPPGFHASYFHQLNLYSHGSTCLCGHCSFQYERYLMAPGCGPQPVGG